MGIAILGAGILGTCVALALAERGRRVVLYERNAEALTEASLHNEGKLHLGFVYAADPTLRTARTMIEGAVHFFDLLARWMPHSELEAMSARPFDYVVHRDSMIDVAQIERHFGEVATLIDRYCAGREGLLPLDPHRPRWQRTNEDDLRAIYDPKTVLAAYRTCEIAADPWVVARNLTRALAAEPKIEMRSLTHVDAVEDRAGGGFDVIAHGDDGIARRDGRYDAVVNALWANRPAIDIAYGLKLRGQWINRRKLGVNFMLPGQPKDLPSVTVMLGPFGDVVCYQSGRVYLSWYPDCMLGTSLTPEQTDWNALLEGVDKPLVAARTVAALSAICPGVAPALARATAAPIVNGGSIYALGKTDIMDAKSQLHERFDVGIESRGAYFSVDTSKYTLGPAIAAETVRRVDAVLGTA